MVPLGARGRRCRALLPRRLFPASRQLVQSGAYPQMRKPPRGPPRHSWRRGPSPAHSGARLWPPGRLLWRQQARPRPPQNDDFRVFNQQQAPLRTESPDQTRALSNQTTRALSNRQAPTSHPVPILFPPWSHPLHTLIAPSPHPVSTRRDAWTLRAAACSCRASWFKMAPNY